MQPDERLYATLIAAAGAAGRLQLAFELRGEMRLENLVPGEVRCLVLAVGMSHFPVRTVCRRAGVRLCIGCRGEVSVHRTSASLSPEIGVTVERMSQRASNGVMAALPSGPC